VAPDAAPHEVRKTVTVVFADVAGSTGLGERLDPESVRRIMHRYFEEMRAAVERHDGTVEPSHEGLRTPRADAIDQPGDRSPTLSRHEHASR
jgi:hypothetical protein